jgi:hypothetical protein
MNMSNSKQARKQAGQNMRMRRLREKQREIAAEMVRDVGRVADPFEAERWASWVHGKIWEQRYKAPPTRHLDWALVLGARIAEDLAEIGTADAKACLYALSWADQGAFGALCEKLISDLGHVEMPAWAHRISEVELVRAAADQRPGDATVLLFDVRREGNDPHTLCVYVDERHDGIAKHLHLMLPFEEMPVAGCAASRQDSPMWFVPVGLGWACRQARQAVQRTDEDDDPPIGEIYAENRAMTLARVAPYVVEAAGESRLAA